MSASIVTSSTSSPRYNIDDWKQLSGSSARELSKLIYVLSNQNIVNTNKSVERLNSIELQRSNRSFSLQSLNNILEGDATCKENDNVVEWAELTKHQLEELKDADTEVELLARLCEQFFNKLYENIDNGNEVENKNGNSQNLNSTIEEQQQLIQELQLELRSTESKNKLLHEKLDSHKRESLRLGTELMETENEILRMKNIIKQTEGLKSTLRQTQQEHQTIKRMQASPSLSRSKHKRAYNSRLSTSSTPIAFGNTPGKLRFEEGREGDVSDDDIDERHEYESIVDESIGIIPETTKEKMESFFDSVSEQPQLAANTIDNCVHCKPKLSRLHNELKTARKAKLIAEEKSFVLEEQVTALESEWRMAECKSSTLVEELEELKQLTLSYREANATKVSMEKEEQDESYSNKRLSLVEELHISKIESMVDAETQTIQFDIFQEKSMTNDEVQSLPSSDNICAIIDPFDDSKSLPSDLKLEFEIKSFHMETQTDLDSVSFDAIILQHNKQNNETKHALIMREIRKEIAALGIAAEHNQMDKETIPIVSQIEITNKETKHMEVQTEITNKETKHMEVQTEAIHKETKHMEVQTEITNKETKHMEVQTEITNKETKHMEVQTETIDNTTKHIEIQTETLDSTSISVQTDQDHSISAISPINHVIHKGSQTQATSTSTAQSQVEVPLNEVGTNVNFYMDDINEAELLYSRDRCDSEITITDEMLLDDSCDFKPEMVDKEVTCNLLIEQQPPEQEEEKNPIFLYHDAPDHKVREDFVVALRSMQENKAMTMKGQLMVKSQGIAMRKWRTKYVEMEGPAISVYKSETEKRQVLRIPLDGVEIRVLHCSVHDEAHESDHRNKAVAHEFLVWHPTRAVYQLSAQSEPELFLWVEAIQSQCTSVAIRPRRCGAGYLQLKKGSRHFAVLRSNGIHFYGKVTDKVAKNVILLTSKSKVKACYPDTKSFTVENSTGTITKVTADCRKDCEWWVDSLVAHTMGIVSWGALHGLRDGPFGCKSF